MGKGLKMLVIGALFGLLAVFAFIGVKSMLNDQKMVTQDNGFVAIPPEGSVEGANTTNDTAEQDESIAGSDEDLPNFTLEGEEDSETVDAAGANNRDNANTTAPDMNDPDQFELVEEYGQLNLSLSDPDNASVEGEFVVFDQDGLQVAASSGGQEASFDLTPGNYRVVVSANGKRTERNLGIYKDKMTNARFELPSTVNTNTASNNADTSQPADNTDNKQSESAKGQLLVYVRAAENNTPLKSNIYVQTNNGQHVAKANYSDSADFLLTAGTYKITVKARDRQDLVKTVRVGAGAALRETFSLQSITVSNNTSTQAQNQTQNQAPAKQEGTLKMQLQTGEGLPQRARFTIRESAGGVRLADLGPASTAELQLPPGAYTVEIDFGRQQGSDERHVRSIDIAAGKTSTVTFNAADFVEKSNTRPARPVNRPNSTNQNSTQNSTQTAPQARGVLQLNAISGVDNTPLSVSFTVSTLDGRVLQRLNNVSSAEVNVPVGDVQVLINYKEMSGSEIINIKAGEPTVYTFTISPQTSQMFQQQPSSPEQQLINQIQQEITRRLQ